MKVIEEVLAMQELCGHAAHPLVFVPTMGALHEGHAALLRQARTLAGASGTVVISIFLNPKQFNDANDLNKYPQPFDADKIICQNTGVDLIFHPSVKEMYPPEASVIVQETKLSHHLCGGSRPGHFEGVTTILTKLFNIITPNQVVLGEKDWQQLTITRHLVRDLNFPITVIGHPTVREADGLALSSRNIRLSDDERKVAPKIYQILEQIRAHVLKGDSDVSKLLGTAQAALSLIPKATLDYVEMVDENTLQPLQKIILGKTPARLLVAVTLGSTRLIDNIALVA